MHNVAIKVVPLFPLGNPAKKIGDATRGFKPYAVTDNKED